MPPACWGHFLRAGCLVTCKQRQTGETPMDKNTKTEIWDLAAGTFIAISVVSGAAFIICSAIH